MIIPLIPFLQDPETRNAANTLLNAVVDGGNAKEVFLKLSEAISLTLDSDNEDALLCLIAAQERVSLKITTNRPSRFIAELTQSFLKATVNTNLEDVIQRSIESGAIHHFEKQARDEERETVDRLLRSFLTYVVECTAQYDGLSHDLFIVKHPELQLVKEVKHGRGRPYYVEYFPDVDELLDFNESDDESDDSYPDGREIPFSQAGSIIILAKLINEEIYTLNQCFDVIGVCVNQTSSAVQDAGVYLASLITRSQELELKRLSSLQDERLLLCLQSIASISASSPVPELRMSAHYLVFDILKVCDEEFNHDYLVDTLLHCPFEALKVSTVTIVKDLTFESGRMESIVSAMLVIDDEERVKYWTQVANFLIYMLQARSSSTLITAARAWHQTIVSRHIDDGILELSLERVAQLLPN